MKDCQVSPVLVTAASIEHVVVAAIKTSVLPVSICPTRPACINLVQLSIRHTTQRSQWYAVPVYNLVQLSVRHTTQRSLWYAVPVFLSMMLAPCYSCYVQ